MEIRPMRMSRHLPLCLLALLPLASCDPLDLAESRSHRRPVRPPENMPPTNPEPQPVPPPDNRPVPDRYPMAQRTENPNQVLSPFPPYNVIDVTGFNSGQLARDPSNQQIFRIP
jgi:hypothetical protein